jgi:hypothetical protein
MNTAAQYWIIRRSDLARNILRATKPLPGKMSTDPSSGSRVPTAIPIAPTAFRIRDQSMYEFIAAW